MRQMDISKMITTCGIYLSVNLLFVCLKIFVILCLYLSIAMLPNKSFFMEVFILKMQRV